MLGSVEYVLYNGYFSCVSARRGVHSFLGERFSATVGGVYFIVTILHSYSSGHS